MLRPPWLTPRDTRAAPGPQDRLTASPERYLPRSYRAEQRANAALVIRGLVSGLERKAGVPIAVEAGVPRTPVQSFVGAGKWDDGAVMAELRRHAREELADGQAALVLDPSTSPKSGAESCGAARQWCGRLGKQDNCQLGVLLAYAVPGGYAPLDRRLYLPKDWAADAGGARGATSPRGAKSQEAWRIAVELLKRRRKDLPHAWATGDGELGRPAGLRGWLRRRGTRYVLDVPCSTSARDLEGRRPPWRHAGRGRKRGSRSAAPTRGRPGSRSHAGPA